MALNDRLRAAVFARDKAICAFSGLSLWVLDDGAAPWTQGDWPDHIKPHSRGGADTLDNLVSASHFYNSKKSQNGRDNQFLFRNGVPTSYFYWSHGRLNDEQASMIRRHAAIVESDWYFNRALWNLIVAMHNEWVGVEKTRTTDYWIASAEKRLARWRIVSVTDAAFETRGLVARPDETDVQLMLSLRTATGNDLRAVHRALARQYAANSTAVWRFNEARSLNARARIVEKAQSNTMVTKAVREALGHNLATLRSAQAA